ncbi:hypothetical protein ACJ3XI_01425 [Litorimonas sp. RW-G-Af-16]|uniref:hypothetical protein n=1 Tax=Litorimonas sp. RW-G-Af-16 TaxID=3241168 RepID=UPI00390C82B6
MGDDLIFAQDFVDITTNELSDFFAQSDRPTSETLMASMTRVQRGAKRLHARGIYQSAQAVMSCLNSAPLSEDTLSGRLLALNKLIAQYADGLSELNKALGSEDSETGLAEVAELAALAEPASLPTTNTPTEPANDYAAAKQTLLGVMAFAEADEVSALTRLMDAAEQKPSHEPQIPLESVMRDIVQDALAIARMCAKTISVSYDVGRSGVTESAMPSLQIRISQTLRALILETLPTDKVGHIDLTCNGHDVMLKVQGPTPQFVPRGVTFDAQDGEKLTARLPLIETPVTEEPVEAPRRMITDETEGELRAQLSKLLEGGAEASNDELALGDDVLAEVGT